MNLQASDVLAVSDFTRRVRAVLADQVIEVRLFGSKARGDGGPDSDIDVLVVGQRPGAMAGIHCRQRHRFRCEPRTRNVYLSDRDNEEGSRGPGAESLPADAGSAD